MTQAVGTSVITNHNHSTWWCAYFRCSFKFDILVPCPTADVWVDFIFLFMVKRKLGQWHIMSYLFA